MTADGGARKGAALVETITDSKYSSDSNSNSSSYSNNSNNSNHSNKHDGDNSNNTSTEVLEREPLSPRRTGTDASGEPQALQTRLDSRL